MSLTYPIRTGPAKVYAASSLPHTPLSRYIESRVRQRLSKLEDEAAAATLSIRLISNVEVSNRWSYVDKMNQRVGYLKNASAILFLLCSTSALFIFSVLLWYSIPGCCRRFVCHVLDVCIMFWEKRRVLAIA